MVDKRRNFQWLSTTQTFLIHQHLTRQSISLEISTRRKCGCRISSSNAAAIVWECHLTFYCLEVLRRPLYRIVFPCKRHSIEADWFFLDQDIRNGVSSSQPYSHFRFQFIQNCTDRGTNGSLPLCKKISWWTGAKSSRKAMIIYELKSNHLMRITTSLILLRLSCFLLRLNFLANSDCTLLDINSFATCFMYRNGWKMGPSFIFPTK